jgi:hypothetical protein
MCFQIGLLFKQDDHQGDNVYEDNHDDEVNLHIGQESVLGSPNKSKGGQRTAEDENQSSKGKI